MIQLLNSVDEDVLLELGIAPIGPNYYCLRCPRVIADSNDDEINSHRSFHRYLDEEPKSIPHQSERPRRQTISGRQNEFFSYER